VKYVLKNEEAHADLIDILLPFILMSIIGMIVFLIQAWSYLYILTETL